MSTLYKPKSLPINKSLVWDYDIPNNTQQDEAFRRWYMARVLTRGSMEDLRSIGLITIYVYLPRLNLPEEIRRFWEWYFNCHPHLRAEYSLTAYDEPKQ
jgi:hypothetical protein